MYSKPQHNEVGIPTHFPHLSWFRFLLVVIKILALLGIEPVGLCWEVSTPTTMSPELQLEIDIFILMKNNLQ